MRVLCVEDEVNLAHLIRGALGSRFKEFLLAYNGEEGLDIFRARHPDVVITDITMPGMDGLEMAREIHRINPEIPIIVLSAYSDKEKLLGAIDAGIVKYFIKPFDPEELLGYLESLAEKLAQDRQIYLEPGFLYDRGEGILYRGKDPLYLNEREHRFLDTLLSKPGHILDSAAIKELLWPGERTTDDAVRVFINRFRQKTDRELIRNRSGVGYYIVPR
jgi:DNA-binding response OmpR family regulator